MELQKTLESKYHLVNEEIARIEAINSESYKTSGAFRYNPTNSYSCIDITSTTNQAELIHAFAFIKNKEAQYLEAAEEIGLTEFPLFKWCGYMPQDWFLSVSAFYNTLYCCIDVRNSGCSFCSAYLAGV